MSEYKGLYFYLKKLAAGSIAMSLVQASKKVVGLLLLPVFTYYLSPEDFGTLSMITLTMTVLALIYNSGVVSASARLYFDTEDEAEHKRIFGSAFWFFIFFPLLVLLAAIIFGDMFFGKIFKNFSFYPYGFLAIILSFFSQPKRIWAQLQVVSYHVPKLAMYTFIAFLISLLSSILFVVILKMGILGRVLGMFVGPIFLFVVSFVEIQKYAARFFSFSKMVEILKFGFPLIFAIWAYSLLNLTDRYMLERMTSLKQLGFYDIAHRIAVVPLFISMGFRQMWTPIFYDNMNSKNYRIISRLMSLFVFGMSFVCAVIILFSKEVFLLIINERYVESIAIVPWIVLGTFFLGALPISNAFLGYEKKFKQTSIIATIASLMNIVLNYFLINKIGVIGAALATSISYCAYFLMSITLTRKDFTKVFKLGKALISFLFLAISVLLVTYFNNNMIVWHEILIKISLLILWIIIILHSGLIGKSDLAAVKEKMMKNKKLKGIVK